MYYHKKVLKKILIRNIETLEILLHPLVPHTLSPPNSFYFFQRKSSFLIRCIGSTPTLLLVFAGSQIKRAIFFLGFQIKNTIFFYVNISISNLTIYILKKRVEVKLDYYVIWAAGDREY